MSVCSAAVRCCECTSELPSLKARIYKFSCPAYQEHTVSCIFTPQLKKQYRTPWENDPGFGEREVEDGPPLAFAHETMGIPMSQAQPCTFAHPTHKHAPSTQPHTHDSGPLHQLWENPSPISQWSLSSTDWLKLRNSTRKHEVNLST